MKSTLEMVDAIWSINNLTFRFMCIRVNIGDFDTTEASVNCEIGSELFLYYDKFFG